jgi:hypothetical protein
VTLGCGERQFDQWKNVCNIYKLAVSCQIWTMLTFQLEKRTAFILLGLTWTVSRWLNSETITQKYTATIHKQDLILSRTESHQLHDLLTKIHELLTAASLDRHCEHVQTRNSATTRCQVTLESLITDTVCDLVECVLRILLAFVRISTLHGRTWWVLEMIYAVLQVQFSCSFDKSLQEALKWQVVCH